MQEQKPREWWVAIGREERVLITYSNKQSAIDCNDEETIFLVKEVLKEEEDQDV